MLSVNKCKVFVYMLSKLPHPVFLLKGSALSLRGKKTHLEKHVERHLGDHISLNGAGYC